MLKAMKVEISKRCKKITAPAESSFNIQWMYFCGTTDPKITFRVRAVVFFSFSSEQSLE